MKAKAFLSLPLIDMVKQVDTWADLIAGDTPAGEPRDGADPGAVADFDEFVLDFTDNVLLPFKPGSQLEPLSDALLSFAGPTLLPQLRVNALEKVRLVTEWKPLESFAATLPD